MKAQTNTLVRGLTAAVALGAAATLLVPATANAATVAPSQVSTVTLAPTMTYAEQQLAYKLRALNYDRLNLTRTNYKNAKLDYVGMPSSYPVTFAAVNAKANIRISAVAAQLSAARSLTEYYAVGKKVNSEWLLSKVHVKVVRLASDSLKARAAAIAAGKTATSKLLAGQITDAQYAPLAEASGRVAALASADLVRVKAATATAVYPAVSEAAKWVYALDGSVTVPETAGYVAIPGSCALPVADTSWAGTAAEAGPHQWISSADLNAAQARLTNNDVNYTAADAAFTRLSSKVLTNTSLAAASDLRLRAQRIGFLWLSKGDTSARTQLANEATQVVTAGPSGSALTDAGVIEAAATALDWTDQPTEGMPRNAIALRSMWLGAYSCMYEDNLNLRSPDNIGLIYSSSMFQLGIYLAKYDATVGSAVAKAAWTAMAPNFLALSDGGWYEGPAYWNLMSRALVGAVSTAQNVYGTNGPAAIPDLTATAKFLWNATANNGDLPSFADTTADPLRVSFPLWVAHNGTVAEAMPSVRDRLLGLDRLHPSAAEAYELLWWPSAENWSQPVPAKTSAVYSKTGLAAVHSGSATAWLKGSPRYLSHTHLDVGMVGLYANGVEWSVDPGKGNYTTSGYFTISATSPRWSDFKVSANAHSTLTGASRPALGASAPLTLSGSTISTNLKTTIPGSSTATRSVSLASTSMTMVDSITALKAQNWTWRWVTEATVSASGTTTTNPKFTLTDQSKRLTLSVTGVPAGSVVSVTPTTTLSASGRAITVVTIKSPLTTSVRYTTVARW